MYGIFKKSGENAAGLELPRRGRVHLVTATLAVNLLGLALPLLCLQVYDHILPRGGTATLGVLLGGLVAALFFDLVLRLARAALVGWNGAAFEHNLSLRMVDRLLGADLAGTGQGGDAHLPYLFAPARLREKAGGATLVTLVDMVFVGVYLGFIAFLAGPLVVAAVAVLAVFGLVCLAGGRGLAAAGAALGAADRVRYGFARHSFAGLRTIRALGLEGHFQRRYEAVQHASDAAGLGATLGRVHLFNTGQIFSQLMIAAMMAAGAFMVMQDRLTAGALVACLLLSGRLVWPVYRGLQLWLQAQGVQRAAADAAHVLGLPQARVAAQSGQMVAGLLRAEGVSFRYGGAAEGLLNAIDLTLAPGQAVVVDGAPGCGRSTLLKVLSGLYQPTEGQVTLGGKPIGEVLAQVALVGPEPTAFRGTVLENLTGFGQISSRKALEMAARLGLDARLAALPRGVDTLLCGATQNVMPRSLLQMVTMARAFATHPRTILLDDASRCLDGPDLKALAAYLREVLPQVSLVMATMEPVLCALADRHMLLKHGKLMSSPAERLKK